MPRIVKSAVALAFIWGLVGCGACNVANYVVRNHPDPTKHAAGGRTICLTCDGEDRQCVEYDRPGPVLTKCLGL